MDLDEIRWIIRKCFGPLIEMELRAAEVAPGTTRVVVKFGNAVAHTSLVVMHRGTEGEALAHVAKVLCGKQAATLRVERVAGLPSSAISEWFRFISANAGLMLVTTRLLVFKRLVARALLAVHDERLQRQQWRDGGGLGIEPGSLQEAEARTANALEEVGAFDRFVAHEADKRLLLPLCGGLMRHTESGAAMACPNVATRVGASGGEVRFACDEPRHGEGIAAWNELPWAEDLRASLRDAIAEIEAR